MKIAIDISQIVFQGSGIATYTNKLIGNLLKFNQENEYLLFGSSLRQAKTIKNFYRSLEKKKNVSLKLFPFPPLVLEKLWNQWHQIKLENLIGKVDLIHTSDWLEPPSRLPKVTTVHDLIVYRYPESFQKRGGHDIVLNQKRRLEWVKKESRIIMVDSQATKDDLVEILKISKEKVKVVYLAAKENVKRQSLAEVEKVKNKYKLKRAYFLSVGSREPRKNLPGTLKAFTEIANRFPEIDLVIAGKYGWGEDLKIEKAIRDRIHLLGFVSEADLPSLYSGALGFVYPSFYEGFGLPVLEAYQCGCPVVTSNKGSLAEIAGSAAILVDPQKPTEIALGMERVLKMDRKEKEKLIEKGLEQAAKFSWKKTVQGVLAVWREATK